MRFSYSRVETFKTCNYKYKLKYIDNLKTIQVNDHNSPLVLGHALHTGIEKNYDAMERDYFNSYCVCDDRHYTELIKLQYNLKRLKELFPKGRFDEFEVELKTDNYIGYIDYLQYLGRDDNGIHHFNLYDWKHTNNIKNYMDSGQLHLYKYYFEQLYKNSVIDNLYYVFIPKTFIRQRKKKNERLQEFRNRCIDDLSSKPIQQIKIDYDEKKVFTFLEDCSKIINEREFNKNPSKLCDWCEFKEYCLKGDDLMILPKNERVNRKNEAKKKIWLYGQPFSGKTYLANQFPDPLMLNTDGNFTQIDAPVLSIKDEVKTEGRLIKRKYAWDIFKETITELEKGSEFKTIVVDLLEDVYDMCRLAVCNEHNWTHESDDSFKAYDIVRNEFLRTIKRLVNLDYNIVFLSHEDQSRDIMKRSGATTVIKPNLNDKVSLKIAGMVDLVARLENEGGERCISLKSSESQFGGGRLNTKTLGIPCTIEAINELYK